jgi:hypothetical protein
MAGRSKARWSRSNGPALILKRRGKNTCRNVLRLDFEGYRRQEAWTAWKYAMQESGCRLPAQNTSGQSRCFCGAAIDLKNTEAHVYAAHMTGRQSHEIRRVPAAVALQVDSLSLKSK